jgi:FixJ family two-component response regulator
MSARWLISIVDDIESIRDSLPDLLLELGFGARAFASAKGFLASIVVLETRVLLLDIAMRGMRGLALQRERVGRGNIVPVVFITAQPDEGLRRQLFEAGAADVLFKPFTESALPGALTAALGTWNRRRHRRLRFHAIPS